jgi:NitT/TauT family transport system substrate-binding protein
MCDHHGNRSFPGLDEPMISRRDVLRRSAQGAVVVGLAGAVGGHMGSALAQSGVTATHGNGFCNLALFLTHARQLAADDGARLEFVNTPTFADQVTFLGSGQVDMSVVPYTSFVALYDAGAPIRIVAGGGIEGCVIVSQPGLDTAEKLKGKTLGTFQLDTLEVLPYDWLKANGVGFDEVNVRYMGSTPEAVEAFKAGALDWICTIEPYATSLLNDVEGSHMLSDGTDLYGAGYTDCVLAARDTLIDEQPEVLKAIIKGMMEAQLTFEQEREAVLEEVVGRYYKTSMENAVVGATKQPPVVDMRNQTDFILGRVDSLMEMGYIKQKPGREAIDWSLLEAVIEENPELYGRLELKA